MQEASGGARTRRYLMCPPSYFDVAYSINPWMDTARRPDRARAIQQWQSLRDTLSAVGHRVEVAAPAPSLPDMVFAANAAVVLDGKVLVATFRHPQRAGESARFEAWFRDRGFRRVRRAASVNEGEGDHLLASGVLLAGNGPRTAPSANAETQEYLGHPVLGLTLVDPRFYHLDTALAVLDTDDVMYWPGAFSPSSLRRLHRLFPDALEASEDDAAVFGMNAISDGRNVILPAAAHALAGKLAARGYLPRPVDVTELGKAGGGPKCCVLELRGAPAPPDGPTDRPTPTARLRPEGAG
ncbi:dimethylargininase [Kitasatospora sp. NPDC096147]|uniref:dimethylargininase n=1 Tax=Kitasatospora sp. NPDC096147 TaxID=3364093 RepID=UPI00382BF30D